MIKNLERLGLAPTGKEVDIRRVKSGLASQTAVTSAEDWLKQYGQRNQSGKNPEGGKYSDWTGSDKRDLNSPWSAGIYKPTQQRLVRNIKNQKTSPKFSLLPPKKLPLCISHASRNLSSVITTGNYKLCSLLCGEGSSRHLSFFLSFSLLWSWIVVDVPAQSRSNL